MVGSIQLVAYIELNRRGRPSGQIIEKYSRLDYSVCRIELMGSPQAKKYSIHIAGLYSPGCIHKIE